jgi:TM2 domain
MAPNPAAPTPAHYRSKTLATWLAVLLGTLGIHRFYLYGFRDKLAWLHPPAMLVGLLGAQQLREAGQDSPLAWLLLPVLGLMVTVAMSSALVYGLMADARWDARFNPGREGLATGWGAVIGVIVALMVGAAALLGTVAYGGQKFFEWQLESTRQNA